MFGFGALFLKGVHQMKHTHLLLAFFLSISISGSAYARETLEPAQMPQGPETLIADSGFRPTNNGFQFENYSNNIPGLINLTVAEMRRMFGDRVCGSLANGVCTLTPPAKKWMVSQNTSMNSGHCEGLAVLSSLIYSGTLSADPFGSATTPGLVITNNVALQREIAYWFSTQSLRVDATTSNEDLSMTPVQLVQKLETEFQKPAGQRDWFVLGLYKPAYLDGHAVTPYAIDDAGNGVKRIMVYDNNFPNQERFVFVNTISNTWSYTTATNPSEPQSEYTGNESTKTLSLSPISLRLRTPICPFCEEASAQELGATEVTTAPVIFTQREGQYDSVAQYALARQSVDSYAGGTLGYAQTFPLNGSSGSPSQVETLTFQNTIPGGSFDLKRSSFNHTPPASFYVPANAPYTTTVFSVETTKTSTSGILVETKGFYLSVENIVLDPGQADKLVTYLDDAAQIYTATYLTDYSETPLLAAGLETTDADYDVELLVHGEGAGKAATFIMNHQTGKMTIYTQRASGSDSYDINIARIDDTGEHDFQKASVILEANSTHYLNYKDWMMGQPLKVEIDRGRDGTIDQTLYLQNENMVKFFLPIIGR